MKKGLLIFGILMVYFIIGEMHVGAIEIPEEAIRLRVIANSNAENDQNMKLQVKTLVEKEMYQLLRDVKGVEEARSIIQNNIGKIDREIGNLLLREKYPLGYQVDFGYHFFPEKEFQGVSYEEGMYESLLVTLGEGEGNNWWCVLFPPLCLLEASESDEVEYTSFVKEFIEKYL